MYASPLSRTRCGSVAPTPPSVLRQGCRSRSCSLSVLALHKDLRRNEQKGPAFSTPEAVTFEVLTLLRKPDLPSLQPFLSTACDVDAAVRKIKVGDLEVAEAGPLACCAGLMDCAARRLLPGHLLRRCRILSSLALGDTCQQRVAITAETGEEAVFVWVMRREAKEARVEGAQRLQGVDAPGWLVESIRRDTSGDLDALPAAPHPRLSPEVAAHAMLAALRLGALHSAARFLAPGAAQRMATRGQPPPASSPPASSSSSSGNSGGDGGNATNQGEALRAALRRQPYHHLLTHVAADLGSAALLSRQDMLLEVLLRKQAAGRGRAYAPPAAGGGQPEAVTLVLHMRQMPEGSWLVHDVQPPAG